MVQTQRRVVGRCGSPLTADCSVRTYSNETDGAAVAAILWDAATGEEVARLPGTDDRYLQLAFSPDGGRLVAISDGSGDNRDRITVWDVAAATELFVFELDGLGGFAGVPA